MRVAGTEVLDENDALVLVFLETLDRWIYVDVTQRGRLIVTIGPFLSREVAREIAVRWICENLNTPAAWRLAEQRRR